MESKIMNTEKGTVEYVLQGEGPAVLIVHGGHGSCYSEYQQQMLVDGGFSVLTPSRPGYGRTPIESGKTAGATADLFAALVKALGIERISVVGNSAGGPVALEFARKYPGVVDKLILEAAVVKPWFHKLTPQYYGVKVLFRPGYQRKFWDNLKVKLERNEEKVLRGNMKRFTKLPVNDVLRHLRPEDIGALKADMVTANDSGYGFVHDVEHRAHHIERIVCPTLIVHSRYDASVPFSHAEYACRKIQNSELYVAPTESHFIYLGPGSKEVLEKRVAFLHGDGKNP